MLSWVIPRQEPIKALHAEELNTSHDLSSDELKFLSVAVAADEDVASRGERCRARLLWTMFVQGAPAMARSRQTAKDLLEHPSEADRRSVIEANFLLTGSPLRADVQEFASGGGFT